MHVLVLADWARFTTFADISKCDTDICFNADEVFTSPPSEGRGVSVAFDVDRFNAFIRRLDNDELMDTFTARSMVRYIDTNGALSFCWDMKFFTDPADDRPRFVCSLL